jgi:hypothetical protein
MCQIRQNKGENVGKMLNVYYVNGRRHDYRRKWLNHSTEWTLTGFVTTQKDTVLECLSPYRGVQKKNYTRVYPKVSGQASLSENCKWYSSLPLDTVVSLFCELV